MDFLDEETYGLRAERLEVDTPWRPGVSGTELEIMAAQTRIDEKVNFAIANGASKTSAFVGSVLGSIVTDPTTPLSIAGAGAASALGRLAMAGAAGRGAIGASAMLAAEFEVASEAAITRTQGALIKQDPNAEFDEREALLLNVGLGFGLQAVLGIAAKGVVKGGRAIFDKVQVLSEPPIKTLGKIQDAVESTGASRSFADDLLKKAGVDPSTASALRQANAANFFDVSEVDLAGAVSEVLKIARDPKLRHEARKARKANKGKAMDILPPTYKDKMGDLAVTYDSPVIPPRENIQSWVQSLEGVNERIKVEGVNVDIQGGLNVALYKAGKSDFDFAALSGKIQDATGYRIRGSERNATFEDALRQAAKDQVDEIDGKIKSEKAAGLLEKNGEGVVAVRTEVDAFERIHDAMEAVRMTDAVKVIQAPADALGRFKAPVLKDTSIEGIYDPDVTASGHVAIADEAVREQVERLHSIKDLPEEDAVEIVRDILKTREAADAAGRGCGRG
jgi:hypothetical protein